MSINQIWPLVVIYTNYFAAILEAEMSQIMQYTGAQWLELAMLSLNSQMLVCKTCWLDHDVKCLRYLM